MKRKTASKAGADALRKGNNSRQRQNKASNQTIKPGQWTKMEGFQWISENKHIAFQKSLRFRHWSHVVTEKKQSPDIHISSSYIPRQHTTVTSLCIFQRCLNSNNHIWYTSTIWSILISLISYLFISLYHMQYNITKLTPHITLHPTQSRSRVWSNSSLAWELVPQQRLPGPTGNGGCQPERWEALLHIRIHVGTSSLTC